MSSQQSTSSKSPAKASTSGVGTSSARNGAAAASSTEPYESPYMRKPREFNFWRGIYNKDKNYFLGRTPRNWGSLLIFYAIFYTVLAALFAICMQGLFMTLSDTEPKWQLDASRIGSSPGMGFRPISINHMEGSLIKYDSKNKDEVSRWTDMLDDLLEPYKQISKTHRNQVKCDFKTAAKPTDVCEVDISSFGNCTTEKGYGYNRSAPCIFLKLNKIYNWVPEYYDEPLHLPADMPEDLKMHIAKLPADQRKQVWVSCKGENSADNEVLGKVLYHPQPGFPGYFYPYRNVPGYMSPLVAVELQRPELHRLVNVECRAWAKNIVYNGSYRDRQGSVHFEVLVD